MRQHFYNFAHKVLPFDATTQANLWGIISSDKAHSYLQMRWSDAAPTGDAQPSKGLMWIEPVRAFGVEIRTVRMPPPDNVSEAYYGAIAKSEDGAIRYFVCEKGGSSVYWAEWRKDMRIRGEALEKNAPAEINNVFTEFPSQAAPWEISSSAIPGLPYLSSFLMAVCMEMVKNKDANEMAKKSLAAGPGTGAMVRAGASEAPATSGGSSKTVLIICGLIAVAMLIVFLRANGSI